MFVERLTTQQKNNFKHIWHPHNFQIKQSEKSNYTRTYNSWFHLCEMQKLLCAIRSQGNSDLM